MGSGKIDLADARRMSDDVMGHLSPAFERIEIAGSVRRGKAVVGDLELVGLVADYDELGKLITNVGFTIKPGTQDVIPWPLKDQAKYVRIRTFSGVNLDLFVATPENWGSLFLMRTGSGVGPSGGPFDGFVPGIFARFKKLSKGGRMTDCRPTLPTGEQLSVPSEEAFFDLLEMDFVPPEARSTRGAIKDYIR